MEVRQAFGKFREVFLAGGKTQKGCLSQLGIEKNTCAIVKIVT